MGEAAVVVGSVVVVEVVVGVVSVASGSGAAIGVGAMIRFEAVRASIVGFDFR